MATNIEENSVYTYKVLGDNDKVLKKSKTMDEAMLFARNNMTKSKRIVEERVTTVVTTESYYAWINPSLKNKYIE